MAIDMSQFYQVFFEEAAEHLSDMESLLVEVDIGTPDPEEMNAIFRAAHSIKGSSGTFGFNDMTEVTHVMETLLDMVRKEEAELTTDIVDACLDAGDVLRNLLAAHRGEGEADREAAADVSQRLEALCQEAGRSSAGGAPAVEPVRTNETQAAASGGSHYTIEFLPTDAAGRDAEVMENLHQELSAMGRLEVLEAGEGGQCRLRLETSTDRDQIVALIEFLAQDGSLAVTAEGAGDADATDEALTALPAGLRAGWDPAGALAAKFSVATLSPSSSTRMAAWPRNTQAASKKQAAKKYFARIWIMR